MTYIVFHTKSICQCSAQSQISIRAMRLGITILLCQDVEFLILFFCFNRGPKTNILIGFIFETSTFHYVKHVLTNVAEVESS